MIKISQNISLLLTVFLQILATQNLYSQFVSTPASPSAASLSTYLDSPADVFTGIPNIEYDLLSLPTNSKSVKFGFSLRYHPNNIASYQPISDVGKGWSLFGGGLISRTIINDSDDKYIFAPIPETYNPFDDEYNYDFNGYSGKFKFSRDNATGSFSIVNLKPNSLKIEFTNTAATGLKVGNFTITDGNGIKYLFTIFDLSKGSRTVFHLTKIIESNGIEVSNLEYEEIYNKFDNNGTPVKVESINRLTKINSNDWGEIEINFIKNIDYLNSKYDITQINSIHLKNKQGILIKKCKFDYFNDRILRKLEYYGKDENMLDKYEFEYNQQPKGTTDAFGYNLYLDSCDIDHLLYGNAQSSKLGVLEKVKLPTGGYIKYDFEPHTTNQINYASNEKYFRNLNLADEFDESKFSGQDENSYSFVTDPDSFIIEHDLNPLNKTYSHVASYTFDTNNDAGLSNYIFRITETAKYHVTFRGTAYPAGQLGNEPYIYYSIKNGNTTVGTNFGDANCISKMEFTLNPGWYTFNIISNYGGSGDYTFLKETIATDFKRWAYGGGLRIKKISYFTESGLIDASKTIAYEYDDFDEPRNSSGQLLIEKYRENNLMQAKVFYKNVKVTEGTGNGYTKYYFHSPFDKAELTSSATWKHFSILYQGLLNFTETFDSQGRIIKKDKYYYEIAEDQTKKYLYFPHTQGSNFYVSPDFINKRYIKTDYFSYSPYSVTTEKSFETIDPVNYKVKSKVHFGTNDKKNKVSYYYPHDLPQEPNVNTLVSKNMLGALLKTEKYRAGEKLSEEKMVYKNWGNNFFSPEFIQTAKSGESLETSVRYNLIDNIKGHPLEMQQENGMKTSYLWGYNKTLVIAKIENASNAQVKSALGVSDLNAVNETSMAAINSLRSHASLSDAMITTYTHKPLVGVSTITDPKGDTVTYEYDSFGRLKGARDRDGNLISENEYHYKP